MQFFITARKSPTNGLLKFFTADSLYSSDIFSIKVSSTQAGVPEVGPLEIDGPELSASDVGIPEIGILEIGKPMTAENFRHVNPENFIHLISRSTFEAFFGSEW